MTRGFAAAVDADPAAPLAWPCSHCLKSETLEAAGLIPTMPPTRTCRVALPHFFREQQGGSGYGSGRPGQRLHRSLALARCLQSLLALARSPDDLLLNIGGRALNRTGEEPAEPSLPPAPQPWQVELNVFTVGPALRLDDVLRRMPAEIRVHTVTLEDPRQLPLACRDWLIATEPTADLSLYLEDDLVIADPLFLDKQFWFLQRCGGQAVLMPHRWEPIPNRSGQRLLVDGPLRADVIGRYTQPQQAVGRGRFRGEEIVFDRTANPHSGCFCLSPTQVEQLRRQELPREGFISPLETAATLTVLQHFQVLKPALNQRRFLWVEHGHPSFQSYANSWSLQPTTTVGTSLSTPPPPLINPPGALSLGHCYPDQFDPQQPADVAIVIPTVLRPVITRAIESIYQQDFQGRIQILIGIDKPLGPIEPLLQCLEQRPAHISALVLTLPWSTSMRHGGVHAAMDGGSLRTVLSLMANSRAVTYLDDDNTIFPSHIRLLHLALHDKAWAFTQRMLVDERTNLDLAVDRWDSLGPNRGRMAEQGGFVDTNCLMIDKLACSQALTRWAEGPGLASDRGFFAAIRDAPHGEVTEATVRYYIRESNILRQFIKSNAVF